MIEQTYNDLMLLKELRLGHEWAFKQLFEKYRLLLYKKAAYILKDPGLAEDMVQDVFVRLWTERKSITIKNAPSLERYLLMAIRNRCIDEIRRLEKLTKDNTGYILIKETSATFDPFGKEENDRLAIQLSAAINGISASSTRQVFQLAYVEGKSHKEIAQELNIAVSTVKRQVSYALVRLRKMLQYLK